IFGTSAALKAAARPPHSKKVSRYGGGGSRGAHHARGGGRQCDPEDDVGEQSRARAQEGQQPHDTDDGGIKIEIVGQATAHAAYFLVGGGTHEALPATVFSGIYAGRAGRGLLGAAVVAEIRTIRDVPLTIYANHGFTSTERLQKLILLIDT